MEKGETMECSTCTTSMLNTGAHCEFFQVSTLATSAQNLSPSCYPLPSSHIPTSCQVSDKSQQVQYSCLNSSFCIAKFGIKTSLIIKSGIFALATRLCILSYETKLLWKSMNICTLIDKFLKYQLMETDQPSPPLFPRV